VKSRSKLYKSRVAHVDRSKFYTLDEAIAIIKKMPPAKFDESIDIAFNLGIDPRQSDQTVRGAVSLPHGTGKSVRVICVADGDAAVAAQKAGADAVGMDDLIEKIKAGWTDFDVMIATPSAMTKVRTLGRVLGPKGLMPNPKTGTVTDDTGKAVTESKGGRVEFRADKGGAAQVLAGKLSFDAAKLVDNAKTIINAIQRARPSAARGTYMLSCTLSATMSPGVKVDLKEFVRI
jgi:large subunit ribosomal protein L1